MYHSFLIHSSADGHLGCFHVLAIINSAAMNIGVSLVAQMVKNLPTMQKTRFNPWVGKIPWRREWYPTLVFLPGEFHGQRSLVGYSSQGRKESDMTE